MQSLLTRDPPPHPPFYFWYALPQSTSVEMFPALAMMVRAGLEKQKRRETAKEVERCVLEPGVAWWSRDVVLRREEFLGGE